MSAEDISTKDYEWADEDSLAVEADDDAYYSPDQDSSVVVTEPEILTVGRGKVKNELRRLRQMQKNTPLEK